MLNDSTHENRQVDKALDAPLPNSKVKLVVARVEMPYEKW